MEINLAEIIKPKFSPKEVVYVRFHGTKEHVRKMRIDSWTMTMKGNCYGKVSDPVFQYTMDDGSTHAEHNIFSTPAEAFDAE